MKQAPAPRRSARTIVAVAASLLLVGLLSAPSVAEEPADPAEAVSTEAATETVPPDGPTGGAPEEATEDAEQEPSEEAAEDPAAQATQEPSDDADRPDEDASGEPGADATDEPSGDASDGPPPPPEDSDGPGIGVQSVPVPSGNQAVITVKVGGDRTGSAAVAPLAGVTLQLYNGGGGGSTTAVTDAWATCVSDADGDCSFVVPNTQTSIVGNCSTGLGAGANCDRRFWVVQTGVPSGWYANDELRTGGSSQATSYEFRTGTTLRAGNTYSSLSAFMTATGGENRTASGGVWQQSRTNPPPLQQCGINVALVLDLSGSVGSSVGALKGAADTFTDALVGTPSQMSLFSFSTLSPAVNATQNYPGLLSVATQAGANTFKARYASWTASGGTNWDRGLFVPAQAAAGYDVAVVITDGNPTFYGTPAEGPGNFTRLREMENGIFSANALKAQGTRVLAVGVGAGVSDSATGLNLAAISGTTEYNGANIGTADYFQVSDYAAVGQGLRQLALGDCAGSISVVKEIVPSGGTVADATPAGAGWTFDAASSTTGAAIDAPTSRTTDDSSAVNFPITFDGGVTTGTIGITEQQQPGYTLVPVGGANAECTNLGTGASVAVTNDGATGFTVGVPSTAAVSCTVYNEAPALQSSVTVEKEWSINGADPVPDGSQPDGFDAQLTLTGPGAAGATPQEWGVTRPGYTRGDGTTINEELTFGPDAIDPDLCTLDEAAIVESNGNPITPIDLGDDGAEVILLGATNNYVVRNTVTCESRLTLSKDVVGNADPTEWDLSALPAPSNPPDQIPGPSGEAFSPDVTDQVVSGGIPYQLAESDPNPLYAQDDQRTDLQVYPESTGSWACVRVNDLGIVIPGFNDGLNGGVTVPIGVRVECTATNRTGFLTLVKEVTNDNGGTAFPSDFELTVTPRPNPVVPGLEPQTVTGSALPGETIEVRPDHIYDLTETGPDGYALENLVCTVQGVPRATTEIIVEAGQTVACAFLNDDQPSTLTLVKEVTTDNGGSAEPEDWTLEADGPTAGISGPTGDPAVTGVTVDAGDYDLSESGGPDGYTASDWDCGPATVTGSTVTVPNGADVTCTIVNDDEPAQLTLRKVVDAGGTGGTAVPADWTLTATPDGITGQGPVSGNGADGVTAEPVFAGTYDLSEAGPDGYDPGSWVCSGTGGTQADAAITLDSGADVTCTITNTAQPPSLTLVKEVTNDDGGSAEPEDWTLEADGPTTGVSGPTGDPAVTDVAVAIGDYDLSESGGPDGYTAGDWSCEGGLLSGSTVTIGLGQDVTCTIVNDDEPATLTLLKNVVNDNGGTAGPGDWTLSADGPTPVNGPGNSDQVTNQTVDAGDYDLSESGGPDGYTPTDWQCTGGTVSGSTVSVPSGGEVFCAITNDDQPGTLTLVKEVVNDNGGTALPTDWILSADGPTAPISGPSGDPSVTAVTVDAGDYDLDESGPSGYTESLWDCDAPTVNGLTVTVPNGADVTCTITNDDDPATITLIKLVTNDNGGTAGGEDWTLTADGPDFVSGPGNTPSVTQQVIDAGEYELSESGGPPGYTASAWQCVGGSLAGSTVTVPTGADVLCEITNDDEPATLTLLKNVVNDNGGTAGPGDWTLSADGPTPVSGPGNSDQVTNQTVDAGDYDLSESGGPDGYTPTDWQCTGGTVSGSTVSVPSGGEVFCAITNDDEPGTLTLVKEVVNDDGGTAAPGDWTLTADGPTSPISGPSGSPAVTAVSVDAGSYALSESAGPDGYTAGDWDCGPATVVASAVTVPLGGDVTCTIVNDDEPGTLTLEKIVDGGPADPTAWTLTADGPTAGVSGATGDPAVTGATVDAGDYALSESGGPVGYVAGDWECGPAAVDGSTVTVPSGADVTCTITNSFLPARLTLVKVVINDDGRGAEATDWTLSATGTTDTIEGATGSPAVTAAVVEPGAYTLSEEGPAGYDASDWVCEGLLGDVPVVDGAVEVAPHAAVTCTITNDDQPLPPVSTWTVVKSSDPPSGTEVEPGDVVTYTLDARLLSGSGASDVVISDDLSDVLDDATLVAGSIDAGAGTARLRGTTLTWTIPTLSADAVLTYQVVVDDGSEGERLRNVVTAPGAGPCPPAQPSSARVVDDCRTTTHDVPEPPGPIVPPVPPHLPNTGGPAGWLGWVALLLVVIGSVLTAGGRRRTADE
ncbi:hypothetical protein CLV56_1043 [Mumia flava]|uniref:VWFA domain-containing protein n=1 Tax=Mumia flava TaxID=1348852 RepID=A0A2M9BFV4_9ACTN|nr:DUF11 domain-containing protein [Mumia flava]PJJ56830.1 hypothetical protein CLV56_1043 [Mumia flava]